MCVAWPVYPVAKLVQQDVARVINLEIQFHEHQPLHSHARQVKLFPLMGTIVARLDKFMTLARMAVCY